MQECRFWSEYCPIQLTNEISNSVTHDWVWCACFAPPLKCTLVLNVLCTWYHSASHFHSSESSYAYLKMISICTVFLSCCNCIHVYTRSCFIFILFTCPSFGWFYYQLVALPTSLPSSLLSPLLTLLFFPSLSWSSSFSFSDAVSSPSSSLCT